MASDVEIERLFDQPVVVRPDEVEDALNRIWQKSSPVGADESSVRLRVLNFVGIGLQDDARGRFEAVMSALPSHHPCRGILAMTSPGASGVEAAIGARCWYSASGGRHLCSEDVALTGAPGEERPLASAVLALLVPEVPVAAWVIGEPRLTSVLVQELADAADRLFFDSAEAGDCGSAWVDALTVKRAHEIELCDLAWCRTEIWRALVAQLFDSQDALRELARLTSIDIGSGGTQPAAEALLLAGWMISRLGLTLADVAGRDGGLEAMLYDGSRGVRLTVSCNGAARRGAIAMRVRTDGASFIAETHEESGHIHLREEWPGREARRTVAPPPQDDASVFAGALDGGDDPGVYIEAVEGALSLATREGGARGSVPRRS